MTRSRLGCGGGSGNRGPDVLYIMYIFSCCCEHSPCVPCAAHSLVCVCVCGIVMSWGGGRGMGVAREGTYLRVFK